MIYYINLIFYFISKTTLVKQIMEELINENNKLKEKIKILESNISLLRPNFVDICKKKTCEYKKMIEILIDNNLLTDKDFNEIDVCGGTFFHYICGNYPEYISKILEHPLMTQKIFNIRNNDGETCLHIYCSNNNSKYLETLLNFPFMSQELFNACDNNGYTCLHVSCMNKNPEHLQLLLNSPFMSQELFNRTCNNNITCLHISCGNNRLEHLQILLGYQFTRDYFEKINNFSYIEKSEIHLKTKSFITQELFNKSDSWGYTCFHISCENNNPKILKILLNLPFMTQELFNMNNDNDETCIHLACISQNPENLKILLNSTFMTQELFNRGNNRGDTCFHILNKGPYHKYTLKIRSCINILIDSKYISKKLVNTKNNTGQYSSDSFFDIIRRDYTKTKYLLYCDDEHLEAIYKKLRGEKLSRYIDPIKNYINEMRKAIKVISNFFFKVYTRPNGLFYKKKLNQVVNL